MTTWTDCLSSSLDGLPDKDGQSAKTRDNRASVRYAPPSCSPEDGNHYDQDHSISTDNTQPEGLTGPSHGGSVASLEARESQSRQSQRRTDGSSVRGMAKVAQPPVRPLDSQKTETPIPARARTKAPPSPSCNTPRRPATFGDSGQTHH